MTEQIVIDIQRIVTWCGVIAAIGAALGYILKVLKPVKKPFDNIQHKIDKIEDTLIVMSKKIDDDKNRINKHDKKMNEILGDNKMIMESLLLLMKHAESCNNTGEVSNGRIKLEKHLINK